MSIKKCCDFTQVIATENIISLAQLPTALLLDNSTGLLPGLRCHCLDSNKDGVRQDGAVPAL